MTRGLAATCAAVTLVLGLAVVARGATGVGAGRAAAPTVLEKGIENEPFRNGKSIFPELRTLGASFLVYPLVWRDIATSRPVDATDPNDPAYDWSAADQVYAAANAYGIEIVPLVYSSPAWANGGLDGSYGPTNPSDYADFLIAASKRYPLVTKWVVWGEPTRDQLWKPQGIEGAVKYAVLLDRAYAAIKSVDRQDLVIGGNNQPAGANDAHSTSPATWLKRMLLPNGRRPRLDLWGLNPYTSRPIDMALPPMNRYSVDFDDLDTFGKLLDHYYPGKHLKFFITESGTPTDRGNTDWFFHATRLQQAQRMRKMFTAARALGRVAAISNYLLYDQPGPNGWTTGLRTAAGVKKPAWQVFRLEG